jgi:transposase
VAEQRYQAVLAVVSDGETVTDVASRFGVSRQTVHAWLAKYEAAGSRTSGMARTGCGRVRIRPAARSRR